MVDDTSSGKVYGFSINQADGSLTAITGSPFTAGAGSQSLTFDARGAHLYAANFDGNSILAYSINTSSGVLTELAGSPYKVTGTISSSPISAATRSMFSRFLPAPAH